MVEENQMPKKSSKTKAERHKENLKVLSKTTPAKLLKAVVSGAGFTKKNSGERDF